MFLASGAKQVVTFYVYILARGATDQIKMDWFWPQANFFFLHSLMCVSMDIIST